MTPTFEQAVEILKNLPPAELQKVGDWILTRQASLTTTTVSSPEEKERHRRTQAWLAENRERYIGEWVALDGDKLISHGKDGRKVIAEVRAAKVRAPFIELLENDAPFGGW